MTGFKQGSANSPFEDDDVGAEEPTGTSAQTGENPSEKSGSMTGGSDGGSASNDNARSETSDIPYIARRRANGESTQWQRSRLTFYVRDHVEAGERELKNEVETALEEEVTKFDLREAAYLVAQENPEAVAEKLKKMGVGFKL